MAIKFYPSQVIANQKLADKFLCPRFKFKDNSFTFTAGQFIILKIADSVFRDYSISTSPKSLPFWETIVDISPGGPGSKYIQNLKPGDTVEIAGPSGNFILAPASFTHLVLVATGAGISSIKSLIEQLFENHTNIPIYFFWGLRYKRDLFYQDLLAKWAKAHPNFTPDIILSRPEGKWTGKTGHVTEHVANFLPTLPRHTTALYLCGNSAMITDVSQTAEKLGLAQDKIHFEKYFQDAQNH